MNSESTITDIISTEEFPEFRQRLDAMQALLSTEEAPTFVNTIALGLELAVPFQPPNDQRLATRLDELMRHPNEIIINGHNHRWDDEARTYTPF